MKPVLKSFFFFFGILCDQYIKDISYISYMRQDSVLASKVRVFIWDKSSYMRQDSVFVNSIHWNMLGYNSFYQQVGNLRNVFNTEIWIDNSQKRETLIKDARFDQQTHFPPISNMWTFWYQNIISHILKAISVMRKFRRNLWKKISWK